MQAAQTILNMSLMLGLVALGSAVFVAYVETQDNRLTLMVRKYF